MAKQKIVVKVTMSNEKKSRKAMRIAVSISDQIAVTGERIDSVKLTTLLRKGVGNTELMSVDKVEEKKPETKETKPAPEVVPLQIYPYQYYNGYGMPNYYYGFHFIN